MSSRKEKLKDRRLCTVGVAPWQTIDLWASKTTFSPSKSISNGSIDIANQKETVAKSVYRKDVSLCVEKFIYTTSVKNWNLLQKGTSVWLRNYWYVRQIGRIVVLEEYIHNRVRTFEDTVCH